MRVRKSISLPDFTHLHQAASLVLPELWGTSYSHMNDPKRGWEKANKKLCCQLEGETLKEVCEKFIYSYEDLLQNLMWYKMSQIWLLHVFIILGVWFPWTILCFMQGVKSLLTTVYSYITLIHPLFYHENSRCDFRALYLTQTAVPRLPPVWRCWVYLQPV